MARARRHTIATGDGPVEVETLAGRGEYYVHRTPQGSYNVTHGPTGLSVRTGLASVDLAVHFAAYVAARATRTPDDTPFGLAGCDAVREAVREAARGYRTPAWLVSRARAAGGAE